MTVYAAPMITDEDVLYAVRSTKGTISAMIDFLFPSLPTGEYRNAIRSKINHRVKHLVRWGYLETDPATAGLPGRIYWIKGETPPTVSLDPAEMPRTVKLREWISTLPAGTVIEVEQVFRRFDYANTRAFARRLPFCGCRPLDDTRRRFEVVG